MCLATAITAFAQQQTGTLTGTVIDDSGAIVPGVSVQHLQSGEFTSIATNPNGGTTVNLHYTGTNNATLNSRLPAGTRRQRHRARLASRCGWIF